MTDEQNTSSQNSDDEPAVLDTCGLFCPEPVMLLHNRIRELAGGETLKIVATDPSTTRDIPKFCLFLGHELLEQSQQGDQYVYLVRKKSD